jgi:hypothetical protein
MTFIRRQAAILGGLVLSTVLLQVRAQVAGAARSVAPSAVERKRRVMVLTDIGDDPDDRMSLIRLLTYSNQWDVAGILVDTSIHKKNFLSPELVEEILAAYEKVRPNLLLHESGYPTAAALRSRVKLGLPVYGMAGVGAGKDSTASEWIIRELDRADDRPLWVSVWGGASALAQALWKIRQTRGTDETARLVGLLRVYTISDQDDSEPWIRRTFPLLFYVCSPGGNYRASTWIGMAAKEPGSNLEVVGNEWLAKNIQQGHGPLGAAYPDVAYGMEGDTPAYLSLISNGLNDPEHPNLGGWGGRYELTLPRFIPMPSPLGPAMTAVGTGPETRPLWTNAEDTVLSSVDGKSYTSNQATVWR